MTGSQDFPAPPPPSLPSSSSPSSRLPRWTEVETLASAKWLRLQRVHYLDKEGQKRTWDRYQRTTALSNGEADSACVAAIMVGKNKEKELMVVKQYRAGLDKYTLEFPAGLIDDGETPETSAIRELKEETGYTGEILSVSPYLAQTVLGQEATRIVMMKVDTDLPVNQNPQPCAADAGAIEVLRFPLKNLLKELHGHIGDDCVLYEGVNNFALGLSFNPDSIV